MLRNSTKANSTDQQQKMVVYIGANFCLFIQHRAGERCEEHSLCSLRLNMICAVLMLLSSTPSPLTPPLVVCRF